MLRFNQMSQDALENISSLSRTMILNIWSKQPKSFHGEEVEYPQLKPAQIKAETWLLNVAIII